MWAWCQFFFLPHYQLAASPVIMLNLKAPVPPFPSSLFIIWYILNNQVKKLIRIIGQSVSVGKTPTNLLLRTSTYRKTCVSISGGDRGQQGILVTFNSEFTHCLLLFIRLYPEGKVLPFMWLWSYCFARSLHVVYVRFFLAIGILSLRQSSSCKGISQRLDWVLGNVGSIPGLDKASIWLWMQRIHASFILPLYCAVKKLNNFDNLVLLARTVSCRKGSDWCMRKYKHCQNWLWAFGLCSARDSVCPALRTDMGTDQSSINNC